MTERKKISLRPQAAPEGDAPAARRRPPVRGSGTAPRPRPTAAEAAQAAAERQPARPDGRAPEGRLHENEGGWGQRDPRQDERRGPGPRANGPRSGDPRGEPRRSDGPRGAARPDERRHADDRPRRPHPGDAPRGRSEGPGQGQSGHGHDNAPSSPYRNSQRTAPQDRHDERRQPRPSAPVQQAEPREEDGRVRLSKLMSEQGLASRREADEWIEQGWVRVDGEVVDELGTRVFPHQHISIDKMASTQQAQRVTVLLHKPIGYVSGQAEDGYEPAITLIRPENRWADDKLPIELTRGHLRNLAPAGRLDIDSTGLLVLTQDGRIAKHLIGEDSGVEKEYLVRVQWMEQPEAENVAELVPSENIDAMRFGLELDGKPLKPAQVSWQNEQQLRVVLREGRKRQIRRMCEIVGLKVVGLKRVRMGRITLSKLPVGQWRFLRPDERF
jgi:23S rRNA pseudouridine2604 synthase